jgi:phosphoglycerate dehydrogenase-like enzyme
VVKRPRVLFTFQPEDALRRHLTAALEPHCELLIPASTDEDVLVELAEAGVDVLLGWRVAAPLLEAAGERLRLVLNPGAGVGHLVATLKDRDDLVVLNSHGNAENTAESALALLLGLMKRIPQHDAWMRAGRWRTGDREAKSFVLRGRTVGLLGYGQIGRRIARKLSGFDVELCALRTRARDPEPPLTRVYGPGALAEFLDAVSVLFVTLPLTDTTRGLIGAEELARLGRGGLLVHLGRGKVVQEDALYEALAQGTIAGAAIDVWYDYQAEGDGTDDGQDGGKTYPYSRPFHELENVCLSPHRAASPFERLDRWDDVIANLLRFARGALDELTHRVNLRRGY